MATRKELLAVCCNSPIYFVRHQNSHLHSCMRHGVLEFFGSCCSIYLFSLSFSVFSASVIHSVDY